MQMLSCPCRGRHTRGAGKGIAGEKIDREEQEGEVRMDGRQKARANQQCEAHRHTKLRTVV